MRWSFKFLLAAAWAVLLPAENEKKWLFSERTLNARLADQADGAQDSLDSAVPKAVQAKYNDLLSRRSLIVPLGSQNSSLQDKFSLESTMTRAAALVHEDPKRVRDKWFKQATTGRTPPFGHLAPSPNISSDSIWNSMALVAIVNRLDVSTFADGKWQGCELRFVYGRRHNPAELSRFTIIVEFVLPAMAWPEFSKLQHDWADLSSEQLSALPQELENVIEQSGYKDAKLIRIRGNHEVGGAWRFSQWDFRSAGFRQTPLDFQVWKRSRDADRPGFTMMRFWKHKRHADGPEPITIPGRHILTADYTKDDAFLHPPRFLPFNEKIRRLRNVVALEQCTGCHSSETGTFFQHVDDAGRFSQFMVPGGAWDPPLEKLVATSASDAAAYMDVKVHYCVKAPGTDGDASSGACPGPLFVEHKETRRYNDLARRKLFMATILAASPDAPLSDENVAYLKTLSPLFFH